MLTSSPSQVIPILLIAVVAKRGTRTILASPHETSDTRKILSHVIPADAHTRQTIVDWLHIGGAQYAAGLLEQAEVGYAINSHRPSLVEVG
jgi:hypothetical protein